METNIIYFGFQSSPKGEEIQQIVTAALDAANPAKAVLRSVQRSAENVVIDHKVYELSRFRRIFCLAIGKASYQMAQGLIQILGDKLTCGAILSKHADERCTEILPDYFQCLLGNHPVPGEESIQSTRKIVDLLSNCRKDDLVFCMISGGGSALFTMPEKGISLDGLQELTQQLLACGAEINEINTIRKHLDSVKGGKLAKLLYPAHVVTLILSDVVGSPMDMIASGPTIPNSSTYADAIAILRKYELLGKVSPVIQEYFTNGMNGKISETPKPGDISFEYTQNILVSSNYLAALAAVEAARKLKYNSFLLTSFLQGEACQAGRIMGGILKQCALTGEPVLRPACIIAGGETTVKLSGDGLGGRNLEVALGAVQEIAGLENVALVTLATDGEDGPTDAAGAIVRGDTLAKARLAGLLSPSEYLGRNDSYHFFEPLGNLIKTGPTGTNVNDLVFLFAF